MLYSHQENAKAAFFTINRSEKRIIMPKKIADIKYEFEHSPMGEWNQLFDEYKDDGRSGVAKLITTYQKKQKIYQLRF